MIRVRFDDRLSKALIALGRTLTMDDLIAALEVGAEPIRAQAASLAPRDEAAGAPHLADNIVIGVVSQAALERRDRVGEAVVEIGPALKPSDHFYGYFQEFGTVHHAAHPYMRPAFDAGADAALKRIAQEFWVALRPALSSETGAFSGGVGARGL